MHYPSYLLAAATSLQAVTASPTLLRGSSRDEENNGQPSSSRRLFEEFAHFFYEAMDATEKAAPNKRSAFSDRLHLLSNFSFANETTSLGDSKASYYYMEWFLTGDDLGCSLDSVSHIKLKCSNGGRIHVDRACFVHGLDTAVCLHATDETFDYTSEYFGAWCSGNNSTELGLSVELGGSNATCSSASGETAHGISLGQACGVFGEKNFTLVVQPEFCDDSTQFLAADAGDGTNDRCMAIAQASQDNLLVSLPVVKASASLSRAACIYDL